MFIELIRGINIRLPFLMCWLVFFWATLPDLAYHARCGLKYVRRRLIVSRTRRSS
jgi:hypothetical protein